MVMTTLVLRQELQNEYLHSVTKPHYLIKQNASMCHKEKQITTTKGGAGYYKTVPDPQRPSYFPVLVKLMGIFPDYTHENAFCFQFQLRKLVPTIFSL